jgi:hypothetical protein
MKRAVPYPPLPQKRAPHPPGGAFAFRVPVDRRQRMGGPRGGAIVACFDSQWPNLNFAVANFEL